MRILILNWRDPKNPKSGGAEAVTLEHAKYWAKEGNEVTWFTSSFKHAKKKEDIDGVEIVRRGSYLTVFFIAPLFYFFSSKKFDIVVDEIHGIPFFTPLYVRKPRIAFIHEIAKEIWDYMYPFPINIFGKIIEPFYLSIYKHEYFWVPAKSTRDELLEIGVARENITIILCGLNQKPLKKIWKEKENVPTFVFVSRVVKMKGIEDVIRSFKVILSRLNNANLWIVGDGSKDYISHLKKLVSDNSLEKKVTFFGYVDDEKKISLLKKAHLLLHASIKEGWGLVVVEAASQSTPSVVYNVAGLRDSVRNGKTGIVVSKNDPETLATEAIGLLSNEKKYKTMQENCLAWASELRWEKFTHESIELLKKISEKND